MRDAPGARSAVKPGMHAISARTTRAISGGGLFVALACWGLSLADLERPAPIWWRFAGLVAFLAAVVMYRRDEAKSLLSDAVAALRDSPRVHLAALAGVVVIASVVRIAVAGLDLRHDETFTYQVYARAPLSESMATYGLVNNHLLNTFLIHGAWRVLGDTNWAIRLPALLAGIALIPAIYAAGRALYSARVGLIAAALATGAGALVDYSGNGRGYAVSWLAFVLLIILSVRLSRERCLLCWVLWAAIAAMGLFSVPVMVLSMGALSLWLTAQFVITRQPRRILELGGAIAGALALAALFYADTIGEPAWEYTKEVPYTAWELILDITNAITLPLGGWYGVVPLALVLAGIVLHRRIGRTAISLPLAALVAVPLMVLILPEPPPFQRSWLWLAPVVMIGAAAGAVGLAERLRVRPGETAFGAAAVAIAAAMAIGIWTTDQPWGENPPLIGAAELAQWVRDTPPPPGPVLIPSFATPPISMELSRHGIPFGSRLVDSWLAPETPVRAFVVVDGVHKNTIEDELEYWGLHKRVSKKPRLLETFGEFELYDVQADRAPKSS